MVPNPTSHRLICLLELSENVVAFDFWDPE